MSTRSTISKLNSDGTITSIYCHWDGYPSNNGALLLQHYNNEKIIDELLSLGSLSSLGEKINPTIENHSFENQEDSVCVAYHRDRDENLSIKKFCCEAEFNLQRSYREEYNYLWSAGKWYVGRDEQTKLVELTPEMCEIE